MLAFRNLRIYEVTCKNLKRLYLTVNKEMRQWIIALDVFYLFDIHHFSIRGAP